jgi:hypothetical protein
MPFVLFSGPTPTELSQGTCHLMAPVFKSSLGNFAMCPRADRDVFAPIKLINRRNAHVRSGKSVDPITLPVSLSYARLSSAFLLLFFAHGCDLAAHGLGMRRSPTRLVFCL